MCSCTATHICLELANRRQSPFLGFGLVNQPALPDGWYLALTKTVDRVTFSICCPNSKSQARNPIISQRRAPVVTFSRADSLAGGEVNAPSRRRHWLWLATSTGLVGACLSRMPRMGLLFL